MSQMERGERPTVQEQEDSEEGETPADPSAGEWLLGGPELCVPGLPALRGPGVGCRHPQQTPEGCVSGCVREGGLQVRDLPDASLTPLLPTSGPSGWEIRTLLGSSSWGVSDMTRCHSPSWRETKPELKEKRSLVRVLELVPRGAFQRGLHTPVLQPVSGGIGTDRLDGRRCAMCRTVYGWAGVTEAAERRVSQVWTPASDTCVFESRLLCSPAV